MKANLRVMCWCLAGCAALLLLHWPLLRLPYFWDEAGYYVPAARDFYRSGLLIPQSTLPEGHPPLVMIYVGLAWHLLGFSAWAARAAMTLIAAATVAALYTLARRVASREIATWSVLLLALSPLFFAQSTLVHLDLAVALFTTLAVLYLLDEQPWRFALAASLAVLSKETAVVLIPVAWLYAWRRRRAGALRRPAFSTCAALVAPLVPLLAWSLYYHHATGYWTGNRGYLSYNLYSTLSPGRVFWSLLRRGYEVFVGGFNWLLTSSAAVGLWWGRGHGIRGTGFGTGEAGQGTREPTPMPSASPESRTPNPEPPPWRRFLFLTVGLLAVYLLLLSVVGGAILPRYLLPVMPLFFLATVAMVARLPRIPARMILAATAGCFVWGWFINPPYPFPFEDNVAYADYVQLHQRAAQYLGSQPDQPRVLTAWPATDELAEPFLGYVRKPVRVVAVQSFAPQDLAQVAPQSFDLLYLYSRRWEPTGNWMARFPGWLRMQERYFDYHPQIATDDLQSRFHLRLVAKMEQRGQWVRIYSPWPRGQR
jgi:4-amino-4-deoxy-L-arabinose transferase-like glycosyltransferase